MFAAWRNPLVVPTPKKGDLTVCDCCWEAAWMDHAGTFVQCIAESVLPDSQCRFWQGRS